MLWKVIGEAVGRREGDEVCGGTGENLWTTGFELGSELEICSCSDILTEAPRNSCLSGGIGFRTG